MPAVGQDHALEHGAPRALQLSACLLQSAQLPAGMLRLLVLLELGGESRGTLRITTCVPDLLPAVTTESEFEIIFFAAALADDPAVLGQRREVTGRQTEPTQLRERARQDLLQRGAETRAEGFRAGLFGLQKPRSCRDRL